MASFSAQRPFFFFTIMVMTLLSLMAILSTSSTTAVRSYTLEQPSPVGVDYDDTFDLRAASDQIASSGTPPGPPRALQAVGKGRGEPPNSGPSHRGNKAPTFTPSKH